MKPKKALFIRSSSENKEFEDVLTKFLKRSDEKQVDIRRNLKKDKALPNENIRVVWLKFYSSILSFYFWHQ